MTIYPTVLYIKQHSITKLKYFGKTTSKNPLKYKGSGVDWRLHLKEYGSEHIITLWVSEPFTDSIVISEFALAFSKDNNIVESDLWANIIPENGLDGGPSGPNGRKGIPTGQIPWNKGVPCSNKTKKKISDALIGIKRGPSKKKGKPSGKQQNPGTRGTRGPYKKKVDQSFSTNSSIKSAALL
jgi:hypothetical protein